MQLLYNSSVYCDIKGAKYVGGEGGWRSTCALFQQDTVHQIKPSWTRSEGIIRANTMWQDCYWMSEYKCALHYLAYTTRSQVHLDMQFPQTCMIVQYCT